MLKITLCGLLFCSAAVLSAGWKNTDFAEGLKEWRVEPANAMEATVNKGTLRLKALKTMNSQGAVAQRVNRWPEGEFLIFSVDAVSSIPGSAFLQIKTYAGGKELKRYSSGSSGTAFSTLNCRVPAAGADRIEINLRMKLDESRLNTTAEFRNLTVRAETAEDIAARQLELVPLYHSASYYCHFDTEPVNPVVEYRPAGSAAWLPVFPGEWVAEDGQLRGSIVNLKEATDYELRVTAEGRETLQGKFRTWSSRVPIARTVDISTLFNGKSITITESGSPEGYIRYTGTVITGSQDAPLLTVRNAKYLIFDGITFRGGVPHAVEVANSEEIRFLNCDISGWGTPGTPRFDKDGKFYAGDNEKAINFNAGLRLLESTAVTVERCRFHDPAIQTNPWFYSHPSGSTGIFVGPSLKQTVLRWNDFIGSNEHRWNDAVEGWGNFKPNGGFQRDADIYGNCFAFGNDDGIELEGGQMNIRFYNNRIEGFYCGISTVACVRGPSYCFNNLIARPGDEVYGGSNAFKSGDGAGMLYVFHNTVDFRSGLMSVNRKSPLRAVSRNNIFLGESAAIYERENRPGNSFDYDLAYSLTRGSKALTAQDLFRAVNVGENMIVTAPQFAVREKGDYSLKPGTPGSADATPIPNFSAGGARGIRTDGANFPHRPELGFKVDISRIDFAASSAPPQILTVTPQADTDFEIVCNNVCDWISVEPAKGTFRAGVPQTLTVRLVPEKLKYTGLQVGGFLIRRPDGLSRPVLIYADCDDREEFIHPEVAPAAILKGDRTKPATAGTFEFDIARDGVYYAAFRLKEAGTPGVTVNWRIDENPFLIFTRTERFFFYPGRAKTGSSAMAIPDKFELKAGKHTLSWESSAPIVFDQAAITPNPWRLFSRYLP